MKSQLIFAGKFLALAGGYFFTRSHTTTTKYITREKSAPNFAVIFLLQNLKIFIVYHANLYSNVKKQIDLLENDVRLFKAFLKDLSKRRFKEEEVKQLEREIRDLVYDAEDTIDAFEIHTSRDREKDLFEKCIGGQMKLMKMAKEVKVVRMKVKSVFEKSMAVFTEMKRRRVAGEVKMEEEKVSMVCHERESGVSLSHTAKESEKLQVNSMTNTLGFGKTSQKMTSFALQESERSLPLAIGFVFFKNSGRDMCLSPY